MTKIEQNRVLAWRLKVLRAASAAPRNVAQACRHFGLSRKSFYKSRKMLISRATSAGLLQGGFR
jgi:hypothetical protein